MHLTTHLTADEFLRDVQADLARAEAANNLMLGIAMRLTARPERIKQPPYFAAVAADGRLLAAALMTPPNRLIVFGPQADRGSALDMIARDLETRGLPVPGVSGEPGAALAFAEAWRAISGAAHRRILRGRAYELRKVTPPPGAPGRLRAATPEDVDRVGQWHFEFQSEAMHGRVSLEQALEIAAARVADGDVFVWEDGQPASMAVRQRPTLTGISLGSVYTPPPRRGRGYASACVAGLSQLCLDSGYQFCMLFTDLENPTSNSIYQKMGYKPVGDYHEYVFEES